ncbi:MAG: penicillin-binding transpeptidase domain-containing protein [Saprospiraceae bacterium]
MTNQDERMRIIAFVVIGLVLVIVIKLAQLQLFDSSYLDRANATAIDKHTVYPSRGLVYDRNGKLMVFNNAIYDLMVTVSKMDPKMDTTRFCNLLKIDKAGFIEGLNKDFKSGRYSRAVPFPFLKGIPSELFAGFQETLLEFPGFDIQVRNVRGYEVEHGANVLGYIKEVDQQQIDQFKGAYEPGDYIGATGMERQYEQKLRGAKGVKYVLKDNLGREVGPYQSGESDSLAISGLDLVTGLDMDMQAYGESLMVNKTGSIVAIDPRTGEILALVTAPNFNPSDLRIDRDRGDAFKALLNDPLKPFFDRSTMAKYPPGSIFKTVVSLIGMQEGVLWPDRHIPCSGAYYYNGFRWGCRSHPYTDGVPGALQWSCNTYFYTVVRDIIDKYGFNKPNLGLDQFEKYLRQFGFGKSLQTDVVSESAGNIPNTKYYNKLYGKGAWRSTFILSIGIGQGEIELSTIQMANLAAIIANKGWFYIPHLVKSYKNSDHPIDSAFLKKQYTGVAPKYFDPVIEGMYRVVRSGTAQGASLLDITVCGKTGTSQNPHGEDHSVFIGFAPKENPTIAIAVYVENAGHGSTAAAPIASLIMEKYLKGGLSKVGEYREKQIKEMDIVHKVLKKK